MNPTSMRAAAGAMGLAAIAVLAACTGDGESGRESAGESLAARLTRGLQFPQSEVLDGPLPEPTDQRVMLLPLGPTVKIAPEDSGLIALRVQDPEERAVEATLLQFSDSPSYVRVTATEGEGAHIIENEFTAQDDLCEGLCDAVFTVTVTEAIELADGAISQTSTRQVVVDCRDFGDPEACGDTDPSAMTEEQLCGDVTAGEIAWTSDPLLDAHLEAVRLLSDASEAAAQTLDSILDEMSAALELDEPADSAMLTSALGAVIDAHTQDGLSLLLGDQGCALTFAQVWHALRHCDEAAADDATSLACSGVCQPSGDAAACASAESSGCRGLVDGEPCAGSCIGACELTLDAPAACAGTCVGSCDGECPGGSEDCEGPCTGSCTGTCTVPSSATCAGACRGLCDVPAESVPACDAPLAPYCVAPSGDALACAGDCFGTEMVEIAGGPCAVSALAVGRVLPRCEPPVVQLSFAFQPGVETAAQIDFATLVQDLNAPLARTVELLARLELLAVANADLLDAANGEIADRLADLPEDSEDGGVACAQQRVPEAAAWLEAQTAVLQQLLADAALVSPQTVTE